MSVIVIAMIAVVIGKMFVNVAITFGHHVKMCKVLKKISMDDCIMIQLIMFVCGTHTHRESRVDLSSP